MKLAELFLALPQVNEDYGTFPDPADVPKFSPRFSKVIGTFDGYEIWGSREIKAHEVYGIRDSNDVLAFLIIEDQPSPVKLKRLWVKQQNRGGGLATSLLLFVLRKLKLKVLLAHDEVLSDDARGFISRAVSAKKFKVDDKQGKTLSSEEVNKILAQLGKTSDELVLHEEAVPSPLFASGIEGCLSEMWYARGQGLD